MPREGTFILAGGLIVAGIAAIGFLADEIGQALAHTGRLTNFENQGQVCDALLASNRPDLCQKLLLAQTQVDLSAFNAQAQDTSPLDAIGKVIDILPLLIILPLVLPLIKSNK